MILNKKVAWACFLSVKITKVFYCKQQKYLSVLCPRLYAASILSAIVILTNKKI